MSATIICPECSYEVDIDTLDKDSCTSCPGCGLTFHIKDAPVLVPEDDPLTTQVGGEHYVTGAIQPVEFIEANELKFLEGCVVKRVFRHDKPTGKGEQDIDKAIHELQLLRKLRYKDAPK